jgi:hypothetical protein
MLRGLCLGQGLVAPRALLARLVADLVRALRTVPPYASLGIWLGAAAMVGALMILSGTDAAAAEQPFVSCREQAMSGGFTPVPVDIQGEAGSPAAMGTPQTASAIESSSTLIGVPSDLQSSHLLGAQRVAWLASAHRAVNVGATAAKGSVEIGATTADGPELPIESLDGRIIPPRLNWLPRTILLSRTREPAHTAGSQRRRVVIPPLEVGLRSSESLSYTVSPSISRLDWDLGVRSSWLPEFALGSGSISDIADITSRIMSHLAGTSSASVEGQISKLAITALLQILIEGLDLDLDTSPSSSPLQTPMPRMHSSIAIFWRALPPSLSDAHSLASGLQRSGVVIGRELVRFRKFSLGGPSYTFEPWSPTPPEFQQVAADGSRASEPAPGSWSWVVLFLLPPVRMPHLWLWPSQLKALHALAWVLPMERPG